MKQILAESTHPENDFSSEKTDSHVPKCPSSPPKKQKNNMFFWGFKSSDHLKGSSCFGIWPL